jgi:hypothetical protein
MIPFDGDFDAKDAAIIGGIMGFAEESMREEDQELDDEELEEILLNDPSDRDVNLAAFKRSYPEMYRKIVHIIVRQRAVWAQERRDFELVKDELRAMEKCEAMLGKDEK